MAAPASDPKDAARLTHLAWCGAAASKAIGVHVIPLRLCVLAFWSSGLASKVAKSLRNGLLRKSTLEFAGNPHAKNLSATWPQQHETMIIRNIQMAVKASI